MLFVCMLLMAACSNPKASCTNAEFACEDFIKDYMVNPDKVEFVEPRTNELFENHYRVLYKIRSQNVFGGDQTYVVACNLNYKGGEDGDVYETSNWELEEMVFVDELSSVSTTAFRDGKRYVKKIR